MHAYYQSTDLVNVLLSKLILRVIWRLNTFQPTSERMYRSWPSVFIENISLSLEFPATPSSIHTEVSTNTKTVQKYSRNSVLGFEGAQFIFGKSIYYTLYSIVNPDCLPYGWMDGWVNALMLLITGAHRYTYILLVKCTLPPPTEQASSINKLHSSVRNAQFNILVSVVSVVLGPDQTTNDLFYINEILSQDKLPEYFPSPVRSINCLFTVIINTYLSFCYNSKSTSRHGLIPKITYSCVIAYR